MNYSSFVFENNDGIATIRLNDPEKLNALTFQTYGDLEKIMAELASDKSVKVVVLTGTGKGFCSGGSVNDIARQALGLSRAGLKQRARHDHHSFDETRYLAPLEAYVADARTSAQAWLDAYRQRWGKRIEPIFTEAVL